MTSPPEPSPAEDTAAVLAVQVAALRGQVRLIFARLDKAGITGDLNLADRSPNSPAPSPKPSTARRAARCPLLDRPRPRRARRTAR